MVIFIGIGEVGLFCVSDVEKGEKLSRNKSLDEVV